MIEHEEAGSPVDWHEFVAALAVIAEASPAEIQPETRLIEDLAVNSVAGDRRCAPPQQCGREPKRVDLLGVNGAAGLWRAGSPADATCVSSSSAGSDSANGFVSSKLVSASGAAGERAMICSAVVWTVARNAESVSPTFLARRLISGRRNG